MLSSLLQHDTKPGTLMQRPVNIASTHNPHDSQYLLKHHVAAKRSLVQRDTKPGMVMRMSTPHHSPQDIGIVGVDMSLSLSQFLKPLVLVDAPSIAVSIHGRCRFRTVRTPSPTTAWRQAC
jgi:hypothetical protein